MTKSSIICRLFKFFQYFCCILRGNIYVVLAIDRLLFMHKPLIYNNLPGYFTVVLIFLIFIITFLMSLPITIFTDLISAYGLYTCWFSDHGRLLSFYQILFSNSCLVQITLVTMFDVFFLVKVINWSHNRPTGNETNSKQKGNISPIITLLVLNIFSFLFAAPSGVVYMILTTITDSSIEYTRLLTFFIHISWILIFLQSSLNILLYFSRINKFRQILFQLISFHCVTISNVERSSTA
ncbi:unnamed protein product [Heterobilharzia americana]|nr:unnamed protein product [Heterobilharzia americana]